MRLVPVCRGKILASVQNAPCREQTGNNVSSERPAQRDVNVPLPEQRWAEASVLASARVCAPGS